MLGKTKKNLALKITLGLVLIQLLITILLL